MSDQPVLKCSGIYKSYHDGTRTVSVLSGVDLQVNRGQKIAVIGASGSGKSTLLNMLGGLDTPDEGHVEIAGVDIATASESQRGELRNRRIGFVYQFHHLLAEFSALENVCMPLLIRKTGAAQAKQLALDYLTKVGLEHRVDHKPSQLSGGERQRVAIARALVAQPDCVLLDEPTGNLDRHAAENIHDLMLNLCEALAISFIIVTHDIQLAQRMDRIYELLDGKLVESRG